MNRLHLGMDQIKLESWMLVEEYASKHDLNIHTVYKRIERGKLISKKLGRTVLVFEDNKED